MRHTIIAGYGPVGRHIADTLVESGVPITIIEQNAATVAAQRDLGRTIVHGDVSDPNVLDSAGLRDAAALVLTIPDREATLRACRTARDLAPDLHIAVRAAHLADGLLAKDLGADVVTVAEVETAKAMARHVVPLISRTRLRDLKEGAD